MKIKIIGFVFLLILLSTKFSYADVVFPGNSSDTSSCLDGEVQVKCHFAYNQTEDDCAKYKNNSNYRFAFSTNGSSFYDNYYCTKNPTFLDRVNIFLEGAINLVLLAAFYSIRYWYVVPLILIAIVAILYLKNRNSKPSVKM